MISDMSHDCLFLKALHITHKSFQFISGSIYYTIKKKSI